MTLDEEISKLYHGNFGKIDARQTLVESEKTVKPTGFLFWEVSHKSANLETPALNCFKGLVVLMYKIKKVQDNREYVKVLFQNASGDCKSGKTLFSGEDLNLYKNVIEFLLSQGLHLPYDFGVEQYKQKIREFEQNTDIPVYTEAFDNLDFLMKRLMIGIKDHEKKKLSVLSRLHHLHVALYDEFLMHNKADSPFMNLGLEAMLNSSSKHAEPNRMDCCIAAPDGDSPEASLLYRLDQSVHTWYTQCGRIYDLKSPGPFGLLILVEAEGYHVSKPEAKQRYLVLEGYPANRFFYNSVDQLRLHQASFIRKAGVCIKTFPVVLSLPQAIYCLSLLTAKKLGFRKLFINAAHSGEQKSVEYTVREAALMYSVPRDCWEFGKHKEFKLIKDPYNNSELQTLHDPSTNIVLLDKSERPLEVTHFLRKPRLSYKIISKLRRDPNWNGEGFFDTWYNWNRFIMDTFNKWSPQLKREHPYAEVVFKRGKDPQWNLGIGYCKGFEVDVKKECERLGIF